jgi:hypothetical protein
MENGDLESLDLVEELSEYHKMEKKMMISRKDLING